MTLGEYAAVFIAGYLVGSAIYWIFLNGRTIKIFGRTIEL